MRPGGRVCFVVWRRKLDNGWVHEAEQVVERYLEHPEETEEPTCGPGPFSMADADAVTEQLLIAGFEAIELRRSDLPLRMGADLDGRRRPGHVDRPGGRGPAPLGRPRRRDPSPNRRRHPRVLEQFETDDGVLAPSSTWIVSALAPARALRSS